MHLKTDRVVRPFFILLWKEVKRSYSWRFILCIIIICLAMMVDNGLWIRDAFVYGDLSVYCLFFNSIVYSGILSTYFTAMIVCIPYACSLAHTGELDYLTWIIPRCGLTRYSIAKYLACILNGGFCMMMGYGLFLLVLLQWFPMINEQDILSGFDYYPYFNLSVQGNYGLHILVILYNGFLTGCLFAGIGTVASVVVKDRFIALSFPIYSKFIWVQLCRLFAIPVTYRLDYWIYMRSIVYSPTVTLVLSTTCIVALLIGLCALYLRCIRRVTIYA